MTAEPIGLMATYDSTEFLEGIREERVATRWGEAHYCLGELAGRPVALLQRYGRQMELIQHLVNFRANLWGFRELGVRRVIAIDCVGSLRPDLHPGTFVVVDDFLDFTAQGRLSFFEEHGCSVRVDMSTPFCPELRAGLLGTLGEGGHVAREGGVLVGIEGPRFGTRSEGRMFRELGGDVVGTLLVPEIVLAREAEICLALLANCSDYNTQSPRVERRGPGSMEAVYFQGPHRQLPGILRATLERVPVERACPCSRAVPQTIFGRLPEWYSSSGDRMAPDA